MTRIRFNVAYDGTDFCGWQKQTNTSIKSVQQVLSEALEKVFKEKISLFASGRTDSGVHALNQVCHFETAKTPEQLKRWNFNWAIQPHLPPTVVIKKAWIAPSEFHATLSATHKTYRYWVLNQKIQSPFLLRYAALIRRPLDLDYLQECSNHFMGYHDFKSFQSAGTNVVTTTREIYTAQWRQRKDHLLEFEVTGSGFLKQMVRNLVGTVLLLQKKGESPSKMKEILEALDRTKAGPPAPAAGLHLYRVYYPRELDKQCSPL